MRHPQLTIASVDSHCPRVRLYVMPRSPHDNDAFVAADSALTVSLSAACDAGLKQLHVGLPVRRASSCRLRALVLPGATIPATTSCTCGVMRLRLLGSIFVARTALVEVNDWLRASI